MAIRIEHQPSGVPSSRLLETTQKETVMANGKKDGSGKGVGRPGGGRRNANTGGCKRGGPGKGQGGGRGKGQGRKA